MATPLHSDSSPNLSNRSQSCSSLQSDTNIQSRRSSNNSLFGSTGNRRQGVLAKLGSGFQRAFHRFSDKYKSISNLEIKILSTITCYSPEEILQWHKKFLDDCPHGYMTQKQFIAMYSTLCPTKDAERFARHIFRAFDIDQSHTIDFREFLIGISMTSTVSSPEMKLQWIFQVFDIDGNGLLTRAECLEVIGIIVRFNQSQQTEEANLDTDQFIRTAQRRLLTIFDNASDTYCEALTMSQFVEGCQNDELISQILTPSSAPENEELQTF